MLLQVGTEMIKGGSALANAIAKAIQLALAISGTPWNL